MASKNKKNNSVPEGVKQPQDFATSKAEVIEEQQIDFNDREGAHLLVPFSKVKGSDQLRLLGRLRDLLRTSVNESGEIDADKVDANALDVDELADFLDYVGERFAVNVHEFEKFTMGAGNFSRGLDLVMSYAAELGKDEN